MKTWSQVPQRRKQIQVTNTKSPQREVDLSVPNSREATAQCSAPQHTTAHHITAQAAERLHTMYSALHRNTAQHEQGNALAGRPAGRRGHAGHRLGETGRCACGASPDCRWCASPSSPRGPPHRPPCPDLLRTGARSLHHTAPASHHCQCQILPMDCAHHRLARSEGAESEGALVL